MLFFSMLFSVSQDCPLVLQLAQDLHLDQKQPNLYQAYQGDCCSTSSIACGTVNGDQRVLRIEWSNLDLDGQMKTSPFPSNLNLFSIYNNPVSGPFPNNLPSTITQLNFASTLMSGLITNLPPNIQFLSLYASFFSGPIPLLPNGIVTFYANDNQFTGSIPLLPNSLETFSVENNLLNGTLTNFPTAIYVFTASNNRLKGFVPPFQQSTGVLDLSHNEFTGCISSHFTGDDFRITQNKIQGTIHVNSKYIYVQSNLLTNIIIDNPDQVQDCLIDNNPMGTNPYPGLCVGTVRNPTAEELLGCNAITTTLSASSSILGSIQTTETISSQTESAVSSQSSAADSTNNPSQTTETSSSQISSAISSSEVISSTVPSSSAEMTTQTATSSSTLIVSSATSTMQPTQSTQNSTSTESQKSANTQSSAPLSIYTVGTSHFSSVDSSTSKDGTDTQNIDCEDGNGEGKEGNGGNGHQMTLTRTNLTNSTVTTDHLVVKTSPIEQKTQNAQETTKNAGNVICALWGLLGLFVI
eukprot:NODE_630_length_5208_cov_0.377178.p2 type:complete len:525 gc:universal NODE_630_length_5208_cov_0.377178:4842-3268(-)